MEDLMEAASIMDGTNSHGTSVKIITVIQMQQAWAPVIMEQIALDTHLKPIKVIMDVETNIMTTRTTALPTEVEVGVAAMVVVVATCMAHMIHFRSSFPSSSAQEIKSVALKMIQLQSQLAQKLFQFPLVTWMNLAENYDNSQN
jgi:hypothetical protein